MTASQPAGDAGETLVESLLSITILGVALVALLTAMGTAATTGGLHRGQATGAVGVRDAGEALVAPAVPYADCATSYAVPGTGAATFTVQAYWRGGAWQSGCSGAGQDQGAQRVLVRVPPSDSRNHDERVVVVKRRA